MGHFAKPLDQIPEVWNHLRRAAGEVHRVDVRACQPGEDPVKSVAVDDFFPLRTCVYMAVNTGEIAAFADVDLSISPRTAGQHPSSSLLHTTNQELAKRVRGEMRGLLPQNRFRRRCPRSNSRGRGMITRRLPNDAPYILTRLFRAPSVPIRRENRAANWRRLTLTIWGQLLLATFIVPPLLAIALGQILPVGRAASAGLYLIAVSPGAPLTGHSSGHSVLPLAVFPSLIKCESILPFV